MIGLLRQTALWRTLRGLKRGLMPPRHDTMLSPEMCVHEIVIPNPPAVLEAGVSHPWTLRVTNQSAQAWATAGRQPVEISARWITCAGDTFGEPIQFTVPTPRGSMVVSSAVADEPSSKPVKQTKVPSALAANLPVLPELAWRSAFVPVALTGNALTGAD